MKTERKDTILYIVVPCYNEEEALAVSSQTLLHKVEELTDRQLISADSRIVLVDDGSKDRTWNMISSLYEQNKTFAGLRLAHNKGHQNALLAGLMFARQYADVTITIDADLQQDINAMELFLEKYFEGNEIVYGVRNSRHTDSLFKKSTATVFYKLCKLLGCDLYENSADYRLMSKKALDALAEYREINLFLRGIIPTLGFPTDVVHFEVFPRMQGESKYTFSMMVRFALDGITSFSIRPIRFVFGMGIMALVVALGMIIHVFYEHYFGYTVSGWSSILVSIWVLGGLILLSLGIIGEYIGRDYMETKRRPRYYVSEVLKGEPENEQNQTVEE